MSGGAAYGKDVWQGVVGGLAERLGSPGSRGYVGDSGTFGQAVCGVEPECMRSSASYVSMKERRCIPSRR